ncbi:hypothetical protein TYRP_013472 [Tyrophagus putrescentiae]|nr:hypothetical protein TYRP_013472 [Tyrophagus putrescentiae]
MDESKKNTSLRLEEFRNEMNRQREEIKKTLCRQIDQSFETSSDNLLNNVAKFVSGVKLNETIQYKPPSTSSDQYGSRKRSTQPQNQSVHRKKVPPPYLPSVVPSNIDYNPRVDLTFAPRGNPQMIQQMTPQSAIQVAPRVDPRYVDPRQESRYDSRLDPRNDPRLDPRQDPRYNSQNNQFQAPFRQSLPPLGSQNPYNDPRLDPSCDPRQASFDPRSYRDNMSMNFGSGLPGVPYPSTTRPQNVNSQYRDMAHQQQQYFMPPQHNP